MRPLSELNQVELRAVLNHELMHSYTGGEPCLDWVFSQVPDSFREEALLQAFKFSVERMSGQILSEAINAGLLDLPGFTDDIEVAFILRDKLFSSPSPDLQTGHADLLRSISGKLGRDFQLNSIRAAYSPVHADKIGAELQTELNSTRRLEIATANLQSCLAFCPREITTDPSVGNGVVGTFLSHRYDQLAGAEVPFSAMDPHMKVISQFTVTDFSALERLINICDWEWIHVFSEHFIEVLNDRVKTGFGASEAYAITLGFKYAAKHFIEKIGDLSDAELRSLVTPDFLNAYLKVDWISDSNFHKNFHLIEKPEFYRQLLALNARFVADPYIRVMLREYGAGAIQLPQLISADDFELRAGVKHKPKYEYKGLLTLCDMLKDISQIPHMSGVHQTGCAMAMRSYEKSVGFYKTFFAEGNDLKDPETMTEQELLRASVCLLGAIFNYPKIGPLRDLVGLQRELQFKQPGSEVPLNYLIKQIPATEVVEYLQGVNGLIESLLAAEVLGRDCLPMLSYNRQGKVFREELGI